MNPGLERAWHEAWVAARTPKPKGWFSRLEQAYSEPHRHYHNLAHLTECLDQFEATRPLARQPAAVALALWFHDAVYDPRAGDNEEQSAALAAACLRDANVSGALFSSVTQLVLATKKHDTAADPDAPLMVDIDLSILGASAPRFDQYEAQIRLEYEWVPEEVFAGKRAEILEGFLNRERIFSTELFHRQFEERARANLRASIRKLRSAA